MKEKYLLYTHRMVSFESFLNMRGGSLSILFFSRKSFVIDSGILTDSIELILFSPSCLKLVYVFFRPLKKRL